MTPKYPDVNVDLTRVDGNVFAIIGAVRSALKRGGYTDEAKEFTEAAMSSSSYNDVLVLVMRTVATEVE